MAPLILHDHPLSTYTQKVRLALREKHIPFESRVPSTLGHGDPASIPALAAANPRLEVPALEDGALKLFDSSVILAYLDEAYPQVPLLPPSPAHRARARMIQEVCDTAWEAVNWGFFEVHMFRRAQGAEADALLRKAEAHWGQLFAWLETQLEGDYFNGDGSAFGFTDLCVAPVFNRTVLNGYKPAEGSKLQLWHRRIQSRDSVRETFAEVSAVYDKFEAMRAEDNPFRKGGPGRREFRDHRLEWLVKSGGLDIVKRGIEEGTVRFGWPGGI